MSRSYLAVCAVAVAAFPLLSGCFVKATIKGELAAYAEPADGAMAHIRLIGSRNVKVYPNSTCRSLEVPGSGYPAGPQMGGQRKRDLGMPKPVSMPKHFVEIAARANEPITSSFVFYTESTRAGIAGTGMPGTRSSAGCASSRSFVPQEGENYEVIAGWRASSCSIRVMKLVQTDNGQVQRVPIPSERADACPTPAGP